MKSTFVSAPSALSITEWERTKGNSEWILSPAYDLLNVAIVLPDDTEELALTLAGKKKKLKRQHFEQLGKVLGLNIKQIGRTFKRFLLNKPKAMKWIEKSFLSNDMKVAYKELIEKRYRQIELN